MTRTPRPTVATGLLAAGLLALSATGGVGQSVAAKPVPARQPKLPKCTTARLGRSVRTSSGRTFLCTRTVTGSLVWIETRATGSSGAPSTAPIPTSVPQPTTTVPAVAVAPTASTAPPTTIAPTTLAPTTIAPTTLAPTTTIPATGPGTLRLVATGVPGGAIEFNVGCTKPGYRFSNSYLLPVGQAIEISDIAAPVVCALSNVRANRPAIGTAFSIVDSSPPADDEAVVVMPRPSAPATFSFSIGIVVVSPPTFPPIGTKVSAVAA